MNGWLIGIATLLMMGAATLLAPTVAVATRANQLVESRLAAKPLGAASLLNRQPRRNLFSFPAIAGSRQALAIHPKIRVRANQPEDWRFASQHAL